MPLSNQNILITGAAGRIGSAVAKLIHEKGGNLILTDLKSNKLDSLVKELRGLDSKPVHSVHKDITNEKEMNELVNQSFNLVRHVDGVVHCAYPTSLGWGAKFEHLKAENLFEDLKIQLGITILLSQKILERFTKQGGGNLIYISSIQGIRAPKFEHYEGTNMNSPIEYSAIKAGIISITSWLAKYYKNNNIRVNCVSPGGISDNQDRTFTKRYRDSCCNIGMLNSNQIAEAIVFLLSNSSEAINGQNIIIDDGWSL